MDAKVLSATAVSVAALAMGAPALLASGHVLAGWAVFQFFHFACHQDPARCFWILGAPAAVCVRCLGIYLGAAVGACCPARRRLALRLLGAAVVLNAADILTEAVALHGNWPGARLTLGFLLGASAAAFLASNHRDTEAQSF